MKKYFVGEIFWESVPFLLWQHISLNAYQEGNESASSFVKGGCQQECFIFTVRVDVDICIWVSLLGLTGFHWFYFHRNVFIKVPFFETVPSTKYIIFFSLRVQWSPLFLSWLKMKGNASKCFKSSDVFSLDGI